MSYFAPAGATLSLAANATSGTVLGDMSNYQVVPGMALAPGSRSGIDGPTRIITSWTPTTSPVGATFTIDAAFAGSVAFAAGTPFVIDNLAAATSVAAQNNLAVTNLLNALKKWFGLSTTLDQASKTLPFDRAAGAGTYTELTFLLAARKWFGWEHRTVSGTERLLGRTYIDGVTATDSIDINGADGTVDFKVGETSLASAATTNLGNVRSRKVIVSGSTTITSFGSGKNLERIVRFSGPAPSGIVLTHNATSLILPGSANITLAVGDVIRVTSDDSGNWRLLSWTRASGAPGGVAASESTDGVMSADMAKYLNGLMGGMNLVPNGSFERAGVWRLTGATTATLAMLTLQNDGMSGAAYGRITLNGQVTGSPSFTSGQFPVIPGRGYVVGCWTRTNAAVGSTGIIVRIYWYKGDGTASSTTFSTIANAAMVANTWLNTESPAAIAAPADAAFGEVRIIGSASVLDAAGATRLDCDWAYVYETIASAAVLGGKTVPNEALADMTAARIKGRLAGTNGAPQDLTAAQTRGVLGLATTDSPTFAGLVLTTPAALPSYTVATLPAAGTAGRVAYASNARVFNGAGTQETATNGTGSIVVDSGSAWRIAGTNITAIA